MRSSDPVNTDKTVPVFAEVVVLENIGRASEEGRAFHYDVPGDLRGRLAPGHLVVVPFLDRRLPGVVVALSDSSPVAKTKSVEALLDPSPVLTPVQLDLARWISQSTLAPLHECLDLFVPSGIAGRVDTLYALAVEGVPRRLSATQSEVFALLARRGPLRGAQIDRALPRKNWQEALRALARRNVVSKQSVLLPPSVRPKTARFARLVVERAAIAAESLSARADVAARRARVLDLLAREAKPVQLSEVAAATQCAPGDIDALAERELIALGEEEVWRDPLAGKTFVPAEPPTLTDDQQRVWDGVRAAMSGADPSPAFLLRGVTGSGKTEIYLRAVDAALQMGRQAIVLVPEIALTPQTARRFAARFPGRVAVLHSGLSDGERYDVWGRARSGAVDVVIGPR